VASVDLVFPPLTGANYPYLSTPALLAYVRTDSTHIARQHDLNIDAVAWLLSHETVAARIRAAREIVSNLRGRELDGRQSILYARAADLALRGDTLLAALPHALAAIRSTEAIANPAEIAIADQIITAALDANAVGYAPERFNLTEPVWLYSAASPAELKQGIEDLGNSIYEIYDAVLDVGRLTAEVIGISIVYHGQVLPGLCLAAWLKRRRPKVKILVGGPFFTVHRERLTSEPWLFEWVDAFAVYEGEKTLVGYLDAVDGTRTIDSVPGLVWRGPTGVQASGSPEPVDVARLPCPNFDGLPLDAYHLPARTLPLLASRGCYWRCAFCTHHYIYGDSYRVRSPELLAADLAELRTRWDCQHVYFVDESLSPRLLRHISAALPPDGSIRWGCELRAERSLTRADLDTAFRSGCRVFSFGVESMNQRVLDSMGKGIRVNEVDRILNDCHAVGIRVHFMGIVGFPGETAEESDETFEFVRRNAANIDMAGFSYFCLLRHSPIDHLPEHYFVTDVRDLGAHLRFEERRSYRSLRGLSMAESFDRWSSIPGIPALAQALERHGHAQRERFMFCIDERRMGASEPPDSFAILRRLPVQIASCTHDLAEAGRRADDFLRTAGRAYNLVGTTLKQSWEALSLVPLPPSESPPLFAFSPINWQVYALHPSAAYLLVNVHRFGQAEVLARFDKAESLVAQQHINALASAGLLSITENPS
jgi:anaerobic magnesium-protoporphyrin IX monomethyl ester cyclase